MAKFVLKNCRFEANGVDLSDNVSEVEVNMSFDEAETTNMTSVGHERIVGLRNDSYRVTLQQDYAASDVDSVIHPLFDGGTAFTVKVRVNSGAISTTNPSYEGSVVLLAYPPLTGAVGALADFQIDLPVNGKITKVTA